MMLRLSFGLNEEADAVEAAVDATLAAGYRTADVAGVGVADSSTQVVKTTEMADAVIDRIENPERARVPRPL